LWRLRPLLKCSPRFTARCVIIGEMNSPLHRIVRTACGREKLAALRARRGVWAAVRLAWFVAIAAVRDLGRPVTP
jgi:hypothetical protein